MRSVEFATAAEACRACGDDEVVVILRGPGVPDRFGVLPRLIDVSAVEGRPAQQSGGEFIAGYWNFTGREAQKKVGDALRH